MKYEFNELKSIFLKEAYSFPPNSIYRIDYFLEIYIDGFVKENNFYGNDVKTRYFKTCKSDVKRLYLELISFLDKTIGIDETVDDTERSLTLNYGLIKVETSTLAYDKDRKYIGDIVKDFLETKCKEISEEEVEEVF